MAAAERGFGSWVSATVDILLAVLAFGFIWYPMVSLGNAVLGGPASPSLLNWIVGVLAVGGAYTVIAGEWALGGQIGEYVFALIASALLWGFIGMLVIFLSGISVAGDNPVPEAMMWSAAYLTAYIVVYRTSWSLFK